MRAGEDETSLRPRPNTPRSRPDRGFSFIEVVVTIVLLGTVVVGVLAAVRASVHASTISRDAAEVETVLLNAVDRVNRASRTDIGLQCDLSIPVQAAVQTAGWPATSASSAQWHRASGKWEPNACPAGGFAAGLVQRVEITVTNPSGNITRSIQVVKGDA